MSERFEVDIENEKVCYEGQWLGKEELASRIRRMIDGQDFAVGSAGKALEYLQNAVANSRQFAVRLAPDDAALLEQHAGRAGLKGSVFIRQALQAYLAAQPPLEGEVEEERAKRPEAGITTEPIMPGEEELAVPLTERKYQPISSRVLVEEALKLGGSVTKDLVDGGWFKK